VAAWPCGVLVSACSADCRGDLSPVGAVDEPRFGDELGEAVSAGRLSPGVAFVADVDVGRGVRPPSAWLCALVGVEDRM
jgi:hypothetical protein